MHLKHTRQKLEVEITFDPAVIARVNRDKGIWHETASEVAQALEAAQERTLLLRWVRREMGRRLSPRESRFLEEHFFLARSAAAVARNSGVDRSTVARALRRAIVKLRQAALENGTGTPEDDAVVRAIKNRTR